MPVQRPRHLQPLEGRTAFDFSPDRGPEQAHISPEEDERFSEWLAFGQQATRDGGESLWEEPRWEEPPAHLIERLAGRLRRKRSTG